MNMRNVNIVARYESKLLRRDIVFLGFVVIALVGISLWQMIKQGRVNVFWYKVALPSSFPFFSMYYYNLVQVLIALFVCMEVVYRERKKDAMEVFLCRPFRNSEYCILHRSFSRNIQDVPFREYMRAVGMYVYKPLGCRSPF